MVARTRPGQRHVQPRLRLRHRHRLRLKLRLWIRRKLLRISTRARNYYRNNATCASWPVGPPATANKAILRRRDGYSTTTSLNPGGQQSKITEPSNRLIDFNCGESSSIKRKVCRDQRINNSIRRAGSQAAQWWGRPPTKSTPGLLK